MKKVIFTDLDGTLLDDNYSYNKAKVALNLIKKKKIPLVICTSKTKAEIEYYRKKMGNKDPFISENGGAIFIPKDYFKFKFDKKNKDYFIIKLGTSYNKLKSVIRKIKRSINIRGFGNMDVREISRITNLSIKNSKLAKERDYDEPFILIDKKKKKDLIKIIKKNKLNLIKGEKFYHLVGNCGKGKAVKILIELYRTKYNKIKTYAFGDCENDFSMLDVVDFPYLVKKEDNKYTSRKYKKADGVGPDGFNKKVLSILKNCND